MVRLDDADPSSPEKRGSRGQGLVIGLRGLLGLTRAVQGVLGFLGVSCVWLSAYL